MHQLESDWSASLKMAFFVGVITSALDTAKPISLADIARVREMVRSTDPRRNERDAKEIDPSEMDAHERMRRWSVNLRSLLCTGPGRLANSRSDGAHCTNTTTI